MDENKRIRSIDAFRGFAIISMVIINYGIEVSWFPAILKHAPDIGLTIADFVAPLFIFAIGLLYKQSFDKRMSKDGFAKAAGHFAGRYLAIAGIGAVLTAGETVLGVAPNWGVLQAIGAAGLITILFIRLKTYWRLAIGMALLVVYQFVFNAFLLQTAVSSPAYGYMHGGLFGSLAWGAVLILATFLSDLFRKDKKLYLLFSFLFLAVGLAMSILLPDIFAISKNRVSLSYVLITVSASALIFFVFDLIYRNAKGGSFFEWWGANPLLLYVFHQIMLGIFELPGIPSWYQDAPWPLVAAQMIFLLGVLTLIARAMYKKNVFIKL